MTAVPHDRRVLLVGATGLVGGHLLDGLLADPTVAELHALVRRPLSVSHPKLRTHALHLPNVPVLPALDEAYLALGTTLAVAGSREAFRAVDLWGNQAVAEAACRAGVRRIGVVSAAGAHPQSRVFYSQVKGALEEALRSMDLDGLVIARPSLLLGDRGPLGQPPRRAERMAMPLARWLAPYTPVAYRPVHARSVARALLATVPQACGVVELSSGVMAAAY